MTSTEAALVRPTEAQLRWAQFHHKRRARRVRERINRLYQIPKTLEEVEGIMPDDGNSTTSISDFPEEKKRRRPKVSQGRRAMLRVSRRALWRRQEAIAKHGYQGKQELEGDDDDDDILEEIFTTKGRRRRKRGGEERSKRFQAFHAMMMNMAAAPKPTIIIPSKVWTRAPHLEQTYLDDEYLDPKWGIRRRDQEAPAAQSPQGGTAMTVMTPLDRGATWMMHLPKVQTIRRENPYTYYRDPSELPPRSTVSDANSDYTETSLIMQAPGKQKFSQLVAFVHHQMIERGMYNAQGQQTTPNVRMRELGGGVGGKERAVRTPKTPSGAKRRRSHNYLPRMRLRDFVGEGEMPDGYEDYDEPEEALAPPRMRLREFEAGRKEEKRRPSKAQEIAQSLEKDKKKQKDNKIRKMAKTLEGDKTPKMRLRNFTFGEDDAMVKDTKVTGESIPPRRKEHWRSEQFEQALQHMLVAQSSPTASTQSEFFAQVRQRTAAVNQMENIQGSNEFSHTIEEKHITESRGPDFEKTEVPDMEENHTTSESRRPDLEKTEAPDLNNEESDFLAQVQVNAKDALQVGSQQVAGFFNQLRERNESKMISEFFTQVRQTNTSNDSVQESDFFAQVRQMMNLDDETNLDAEPQSEEQQNEAATSTTPSFRRADDQATAGERSGDVPYSRRPDHQTTKDELYPNESTSLKQEKESHSSSRVSTSHTQPGMQGDDNVVLDHPKESPVSEWFNRGRSTFNALASGLNAISESTFQASATPGTDQKTNDEVYPNVSTPPRGGGNVVLDHSKETQEKMVAGERTPRRRNEHRLSEPFEETEVRQDNKIRQMVKSLDGDKTPKMRLQNFTFGEEAEVGEAKVTGKSTPPRRKEHWRSEQFEQAIQHMPGAQPSPTASTKSEFFAKVRQQTAVAQEKMLSGERTPVRRKEHRLSEAFEETEVQQDNKIRQMVKSLDGDKTPKMRLRNFAAGEETEDEELKQGRRTANALASDPTLHVSTNPKAKISDPTNSKERTSNFTSKVGSLSSMLQQEDDSENDHSALAAYRKSQELKRQSMSPDLANLNERTSNMSGEADGLLSMLQQEDESENYLMALAGYRKSQESKRQSMSPDDSSSHSSFRVLPTGVREIIKEKIRSPENSGPMGLTTAKTKQAYEEAIQSSGGVEVSPEKYMKEYEKEIKNSALNYSKVLEKESHGFAPSGDLEHDIIDTDDARSDASGAGMNPYLLANLMLSPELLMKRLHQAIRAIEVKRWPEVNYLLNANPWLAEMTEVTTNQYLLHKLAYFGVGGEAAPEELCHHLVDLFPAAVHKFDQDGNLPLHLAAASGHLKMIKMLGEKFLSGASVRNEDGMLPLHFAIASYGRNNGSQPYGDQESSDGSPSPVPIVKTVLKFFPTAVAIADNDGNLPLHVAVECLNDSIAVDVIYLLLDEADRQLQDPFGARFRNKLKLEAMVTDDMTNISMMMDDLENDSDLHCTMVKNDFDETPLLSAIRAQKGWEIIETLASAPGGESAALFFDGDKNNTLHLLLSDYQDPAAAMSILKIAPTTATHRNNAGMLPIEVACMQLMPEEVILAIALVDLPIDIEDKDEARDRKELGASWWFLTCECDDHYVHIVQEIIAICTFQQIHALCFSKGSRGGTVLSRATPKCRRILQQALRFVGRYEFVGNGALYSDPSIGLQEFEALDFGGESASRNGEEGRRVLLKCYSEQESFLKHTSIFRDLELDSTFFEDVHTFSVNDDPQQQQFCVSVELPQMTLDKVVDGMKSNRNYRHDPNLRRKYAAKICAVLRLIGKSLRHLHTSGAVHGNVCLESCGKFDHIWKLRGRLDVQLAGQRIDPSSFQKSFPPEALQLYNQRGNYDSDNAPVSFKATMTAEPSMDIWAFGKLAYEAILGKALIEFDDKKKPIDDVVSLLQVMEWNESNMKEVFEDLLESGMPESGADLIVSCLFPRPEDRPESMDAVLSHPFWKDIRKYRERSSKPRRSRDSQSVLTQGSKSIFTETETEVGEEVVEI